MADPATMRGWEYKSYFYKNKKSASVQINSSQFIIDAILKNPNEITIVGIGPLSNIAQTLEQNPNIVPLLKKLVLMGGMITPPRLNRKKMPRSFEYNFCTDCASTEKVLKAGFSIELIPGDITFNQNSFWNSKEIKELARIKHPVVRLLMKISNTWLKESATILQNAGLSTDFAQPWLNDSITITYLVKPEFFKTEEKIFRWQLLDRYPRLIESDKGIKIKVETTRIIFNQKVYIKNLKKTITLFPTLPITDALLRRLFPELLFYKQHKDLPFVTI
jgi:inosine-uridine nucleoside N-ribohydrolase